MNFVRPLLVLFAAVMASCVSQQQYQSALEENANLRKQREALEEYSEGLRAQNQRLSDQVQRLGANAADAAWIKEQKAKLSDLLAKFQGSEGSIPGVTFRSGAEGIVVEVQGEVLFASGKTDITSVGQSTLRQLVATLLNSGNKLRIEGHTDTDPIKNSPWRTNLRLSTERALAVAAFLTTEGIPAERIAVGGYGPHRPRLPDATGEAKSKNRRVEIVMIDAP